MRTITFRIEFAEAYPGYFWVSRSETGDGWWPGEWRYMIDEDLSYTLFTKDEARAMIGAVKVSYEMMPDVEQVLVEDLTNV